MPLLLAMRMHFGFRKPKLNIVVHSAQFAATEEAAHARLRFIDPAQPQLSPS